MKDRELFEFLGFDRRARRPNIARRGELQTYFDRTAVDAWKRLTSDAPVGRIRATVRAGRDAMRVTLLSWLPDDMRGLRLLDAGCGKGALVGGGAPRGADVVAVDISPTLVGSGERTRGSAARAPDSIAFAVGDMLHPHRRSLRPYRGGWTC